MDKEQKVIDMEIEWLNARLDEHPDIVTGTYHETKEKLKAKRKEIIETLK